MASHKDRICQNLTRIRQQLWETGQWPPDQKCSLSIPIFKKGDAMENGGDRPIARLFRARVMLHVTEERHLPSGRPGMAFPR